MDPGNIPGLIEKAQASAIGDNPAGKADSPELVILSGGAAADVSAEKPNEEESQYIPKDDRPQYGPPTLQQAKADEVG